MEFFFKNSEKIHNAKKERKLCNIKKNYAIQKKKITIILMIFFINLYKSLRINFQK